MTSVRGMVIPFSVLSNKKREEVNAEPTEFNFCLICGSSEKAKNDDLNLFDRLRVGTS